MLIQNVKNLASIQTVDSPKLARKLNNALASEQKEEEQKEEESNSRTLDVFLQVNTSGEEAKSGLSPSADAILEMALVLRRECPFLTFKGLMTIGLQGDELDFITLRQLRDEVTTRWEEEYAAIEGPLSTNLELSMGMSRDFETAIAQVLLFYLYYYHYYCSFTTK